MYSNDFVVCIKVDGKILREQKDLILLPFGTEYSILMKNLRNEKVLVTSINIDGQDVLNNNQLIIKGKDSLELERFLDNDLNKGNKFKWIEKTEKISNYRGDKPEDGLISVEFQFEKKVIHNDVIYRNDWIYQPYYLSYPNYPIYTWNNNSGEDVNHSFTITCNNNDLMFSAQGSNSKFDNSISKCCSLDNFNDNGITTKGSISEQKFIYGDIGELESNKYIITLQLKGKNKNNSNIEKVIVTNEKVECVVCGTKNSSKGNFCSECGTYLK